MKMMILVIMIVMLVMVSQWKSKVKIMNAKGVLVHLMRTLEQAEFENFLHFCPYLWKVCLHFQGSSEWCVALNNHIKLWPLERHTQPPGSFLYIVF